MSPCKVGVFWEEQERNTLQRLSHAATAGVRHPYAHSVARFLDAEQGVRKARARQGSPNVAESTGLTPRVTSAELLAAAAGHAEAQAGQEPLLWRQG